MSNSPTKPTMTGGHVVVILLSACAFLSLMVVKLVIPNLLTLPIMIDPSYSMNFHIIIWGGLVRGALEIIFPACYVVIFVGCLLKRNTKFLYGFSVLLLLVGTLGSGISLYLISIDEKKPFEFLLGIFLFHTFIGYGYAKFFTRKFPNISQFVGWSSGGLGTTQRSENLNSIIGNERFKKAILFFPHLRTEYDSLKGFGVAFQEHFATVVVEKKEFENSSSILEDVKAKALLQLFGSDKKLQSYGSGLIEFGKMVEAKELIDIIEVLGKSIDANEIIRRLPELNDLRPKQKVSLEILKNQSHLAGSKLSKKSISSTAQQPRRKDLKNVSVEWLMFHSARSGKQESTSNRIYLAKFNDGRYVGFDPNFGQYNFFNSAEHYADKTGIPYREFVLASQEGDREDFLRRLAL